MTAEFYVCAAIACLLFVLLSVTAIKLASIKREVRRFSKEVKKLESKDYNQPVKLNLFDKDMASLANNLNSHVEIQRKLSEEYTAASKNLSNVITGISHDFRTPLTASLGYLQLIAKSGQLDGKYSEYLEIAASKNQYLKELSDEFFEIAKLDSSSEGTYFESFNLSNLAFEQTLSQYEWIESRSISTNFSITEGIIITSNKHYITRILENIFSNASKYALTKLDFSVSRVGEKIKIIASNDSDMNGEADISQVFEPFYRASSRTENGSGLGLYVVKALAQKLGGEAVAELSDDGIFTVSVTV